MPFTIRRATAADAPALALIGAATFLETYSTILPGHDLVAHCAANHSAHKYAGLLADPTCTVWLAEAPLGAPIGYLVLMPATLPVEGPQPGDYEVMRIYVLAPYHKTGVGHRLMNLAIEEARTKHAPRLVLGMHNDNRRALDFYQRKGFSVIAARKFIVGNTVCCDSVLARDIA